MAVRNERGAGRKPALTEEQVQEIKKRHIEGETLTGLAKEYGVSRQTLSGYMHPKKVDYVYQIYRDWVRYNHMFQGVELTDYTLRMDYMWKEEVCTIILVNFCSKEIRIQNQTDNMIHRAFGVKRKPDWEDFLYFLEQRCFPRTRDHADLILEELGLDHFDPLSIIEKTGGRMAEDQQWIRCSYYNRYGSE